MLLPININELNEIDINNISFYHFGVKFDGQGVLRWDVKEGFLLNAYFKPTKNVKLGKRSYGGPKVLRNKLFRFSIDNFWKAYSFIPFLEINEISLMLGAGKLSVSFDNLVLYTDAVYNRDKKAIKGRCLFKLTENTNLPDTVNYEIKLKDKTIFNNKKFKGLLIESDAINIQGYINDDGIFDVSWEINKKLSSKNLEWKIPIAIKDALSISLGQAVVMLRRELYRNNKSIVEFCKERKPIDLGYFRPIKNKGVFDKDKFILFFQVLIKNNKEAIIIRNLFYQIVDSLRVNNFAIWQFMMANSLEAFLRTYYNKPFQIGKKNDKFKGVKFHLFEFKREYFEKDNIKEWRVIFKKVYKYYIDLRHINAHPDWLNSLDFINKQKKIEIINYLSKFYGFIILALAGYKEIKPEL